MKIKTTSILNEVAKYRASSLNDSTEKAPEEKGYYMMLLDREVVYVGKAESGIRARLSSHYNGDRDVDTFSAQQIYENRDHLFVIWRTAQSDKVCVDMEKEWILRYDPLWNERIG